MYNTFDIVAIILIGVCVVILTLLIYAILFVAFAYERDERDG